VKNGQVLYMEHCQKCHPLGEAGLAPAINSNPAPGFLKRFQVRHGLGVMPSFKEEQITTKELMDLSEYLKAMKQK
jgi:mono/diheme cytochrome c family protein